MLVHRGKKRCVEKARGLLINHNIDLANDGDVFYL